MSISGLRFTIWLNGTMARASILMRVAIKMWRSLFLVFTLIRLENTTTISEVPGTSRNVNPAKGISKPITTKNAGRANFVWFS